MGVASCSTFSAELEDRASLWVSPYNFSLDPVSHQLHTSWEVRGKSISFLCAFAEVVLVEIGFTGQEKVWIL